MQMQKIYMSQDLFIFQRILHINISGIPLVGVPDYFPAFVSFFVLEGGGYAVNALCVQCISHLHCIAKKKELTIHAVIHNQCVRLQHQYML